ncbi:hypothetical protein ACFO1C_003750 [Photobacterium damselae]
MGVEQKKLTSFDNEKDFFKHIRTIFFESDAFSNIEFIGITGSVGRKEKKIFDKNLNDIDFIIVGELLDNNKKIALEKQLCISTNTKYTDITILSRNIFNIKSKKTEQYLFDIIHGNLNIFSTPCFLNKINKCRELKLNIKTNSILNLYLTRYFCLSINSNNLDSQFNRYQLKKILNAYIDSILILNDKYETIVFEDKLKLIESYLTKSDFKNLKYLVVNYNSCDYLYLKKQTFYFYKNIKSIVVSNCKVDILLLLIKCIFKPTKEKMILLIKLSTLIYLKEE